jgi:hypothetical protein
MPKFPGLCAALAFALVVGLSNSAGAKAGDKCGGFCWSGPFLDNIKWGYTRLRCPRPK